MPTTRTAVADVPAETVTEPARTARELENAIKRQIASGLGNAKKIAGELAELYPLKPWDSVPVVNAEGKPVMTGKGDDRTQKLGVSIKAYVTSLGIGGEDGFPLPKAARVHAIQVIHDSGVTAPNKDVACLLGASERAIAGYRREMGIARAENTATPRDDSPEVPESVPGTPAVASKRPNVGTLLDRIAEALPYFTAADVETVLTLMMERRSELDSAGDTDEPGESDAL